MKAVVSLDDQKGGWCGRKRAGEAGPCTAFRSQGLGLYFQLAIEKLLNKFK